MQIYFESHYMMTFLIWAAAWLLCGSIFVFFMMWMEYREKRMLTITVEEAFMLLFFVLLGFIDIILFLVFLKEECGDKVIFRFSKKPQEKEQE